jgi:hypothetical protein
MEELLIKREGGVVMRELGMAFKGLLYHFKGCICGIIYTALKGTLRPITKWNRVNV